MHKGPVTGRCRRGANEETRIVDIDSCRSKPRLLPEIRTIGAMTGTSLTTEVSCLRQKSLEREVLSDVEGSMSLWWPRSQHLIAGTVAGTTSTLALYPLELVKTRMQVTTRSQTAYKSIYSSFRSVVTREGVLGLYRGMLPSLIASSGSWGGYFYIYELAKSRRLGYKQANSDRSSSSLWLDGNGSGDQSDLSITSDTASIEASLSSLDHMAAGTVAGVAMVLTFNPLWVIKTRLALQGAEPANVNKYKGLTDACVTLWREEGIRGYYKGLVPALLLTANGSIQVTVYEAMKAELTALRIAWLTASGESFNLAEAAHMPAWASMLLGGSSKIISATLTYPYQVVKSRLQQRAHNISAPIGGEDVIVRRQPYSSTLDCCRSILREDGFAGFFRGIGPNVIKVAPSAAITFMAYEETMKLLKLIK